MALNYTTNRTNGVTVVSLNGAILFGEELASLRLFVKDMLNKSCQVVLDLGEVTRIDSSGLGTLVSLYASARKVGGDIKLANLDSHAHELLQITKLVTVFEVFEKVEDAIASFNRAPTAT